MKRSQSLLRRPGLVPFIWVHHPHTPSPLLDLPNSSDSIVLDAIEYHTPRLLYSGIVYKLDNAMGEVTTLDALTRALKQVVAMRSTSSSTVKGKRKAREMENGQANGHSAMSHGISITVLHAERLRTVLGTGWTVITRLAELTGLDLTVVLCSAVTWDELRPPRGDAPEPVILDIPPPSSDEIRQTLLASSTHPLWPRFLDLIIPVLGNLTPSPQLELEYVAEALWPVYTRNLPDHLEQNLLGRPYPDPANPPPQLQISIKLLTDLKHAMAVPLAVASEELLTRKIGITNFADSLKRAGGAGATPSRFAGITAKTIGEGGLAADLGFCSKVLVVAAYCASYNPPKSDQRLFGRIGTDGKRRRGGARRAGYGRTRVGKIPQRLLGPKPFTLDRLLALFAALYAEHAPRPEDLVPALEHSDDEEEDWALSAVDLAQKRAEKVRAKEREMDERWDDEVEHLTMSTRLWGLIPELEGQGLLKRTSPVDRLDNITLRCEVDYDNVKALAKDLRLTLDEYLYEATS